MFKKIRSFLITTAFMLLSCCSLSAEKQTVKPVFVLDGSSLIEGGQLPGTCNLNFNNNGEVVWCDYIGYKNGNYYKHCFYSDHSKEVIDVTECINNSLLEMGYQPVSMAAECDYDLKFTAYYEDIITFDDSGNVFFTFTHKELNISENIQIRKLGIWNKKFGFKEIVIPSLKDIKIVKLKGDYLLVRKIVDNGNGKVACLSIKDICSE